MRMKDTPETDLKTSNRTNHKRTISLFSKKLLGAGGA